HIELPGPTLPTPPAAGAGELHTLPQTGRQNDKGTRPPLGTPGALRDPKGSRPHRPERRPRLHRRTPPLPPPHGPAGRPLTSNILATDFTDQRRIHTDSFQLIRSSSDWRETTIGFAVLILFQSVQSVAKKCS